MITIKKLAFDHIRKAAKGQFHQEVVDILEKNGVDTLLPESLIAEYKKNILHYTELNGQYAADPKSADLERIDDARDVAYRVIHLSLSAMRLSLDQEVASYYESHIQPLFAAFWDFSTEMDYATETTYLRSFCQKLKALDF
jgi:hypothetical protein